MCAITNNHLTENDPAWIQASLPIRFGRLGFRCAVQLAPSAYLASTACSANLIHQILPSHVQEVTMMHHQRSRHLTSNSHGMSVVSKLLLPLLCWMMFRMLKPMLVFSQLLLGNQVCGCMLFQFFLWAYTWKMMLSGSLLAFALVHHCVFLINCQCCGAEVDCFATHGLSCRWSKCHQYRHAAVNDVIHRLLMSAQVPSRLEPSNIYCSDG